MTFARRSKTLALNQFYRPIPPLRQAADEAQDDHVERHGGRRSRRRLLRLLPTGGRLAVTTFVVLMGIEAVLFPAEIAITGWLVGSVPEAVAGGRGSVAAGNALMAVAALGGVLIARQVIGPAASLLGNRVRRRVDGALLERSQRALYQPVGVTHLHDPAVLDKVNLGGGANSSNVFAPASPGEAAVGVVRLTAMVLASLLAGLIVVRVSWPAALAVLVAAVAARRHSQRHHTAMLRRFKDLAGSYRRAGYTASLPPPRWRPRSAGCSGSATGSSSGTAASGTR